MINFNAVSETIPPCWNFLPADRIAVHLSDVNAKVQKCHNSGRIPAQKGQVQRPKSRKPICCQTPWPWGKHSTPGELMTLGFNLHRAPSLREGFEGSAKWFESPHLSDDLPRFCWKNFWYGIINAPVGSSRTLLWVEVQKVIFALQRPLNLGCNDGHGYTTGLSLWEMEIALSTASSTACDHATRAASVW